MARANIQAKKLAQGKVKVSMFGSFCLKKSKDLWALAQGRPRLWAIGERYRPRSGQKQGGRYTVFGGV